MIGFEPPELLPQIDLALKPLGGKRGYIQAIVVERCEKQCQVVIVEQLRNFIADQTALLQASDMRLEGQGLITTTHIEPSDIKFDPGTYAGRSGG